MPIERLERLPAQEVLRWAVQEFEDRIAYACSFGAEGMVLIDMLARLPKPPRIFTIDTGRLPQETHDLIHTVRSRYGLSIEHFAPDSAAVQEFVTLRGPNAFYESLADRRECCFVRKVEPLNRALSGLDAWITGLRRDQGPSRATIRKLEKDPGHANILKVMPLADWTWQEVWDYLRANDVPYNELHDRGYASIGCGPCTRAVAPGEDQRAGRWWWEQEPHKECGLHISGRQGDLALSVERSA